MQRMPWPCYSPLLPVAPPLSLFFTQSSWQVECTREATTRPAAVDWADASGTGVGAHCWHNSVWCSRAVVAHQWCHVGAGWGGRPRGWRRDKRKRKVKLPADWKHAGGSTNVRGMMRSGSRETLAVIPRNRQLIYCCIPCVPLTERTLCKREITSNDMNIGEIQNIPS
jgi:hypothetical protein